MSHSFSCLSPMASALRLALAAAAAVIVAAPSAWADDPPAVDLEPPLLRAGPLVGYAGHGAATIWVAPLAAGATLEVAYSAVGPAGDERRVAVPAPAPGAVGTSVRLDGLAPATTYRYRVLVGGRADEGTSGTFRTGPAPGRRFRGTFGVVSCMNVRRYASQIAWTELAAKGPDLLLPLADNIYANSTTPSVIRDWYVAQRQVPEYAALLRATSSLAIWDDHDFGANDSDGTLRGKEASLEVFREIWPNPGCGTAETPGVFHRTSFGDVDLFLLDGRYHRSPNGAKDDAAKRMLGDAQFEWLERELRASRATFKLVASGSTISAGLKDCWLLYTRVRDRLFDLTHEVPGIVFLTGDLHQSFVVRLEAGKKKAGYPIYEVVSSGVAVNRAEHFFTTIAVDTEAADPSLKVIIHKLDLEGRDAGREERTIKRSELLPVF